VDQLPEGDGEGEDYDDVEEETLGALVVDDEEDRIDGEDIRTAAERAAATAAMQQRMKQALHRLTAAALKVNTPLPAVRLCGCMAVLYSLLSFYLDSNCMDF